ncbi:hypothetical protein [Sphingobium tyrosinilyticum]|uniref:Uncharacterized protein n=1 Tax=Sphingobium tyrosinilyticum TaxID=2715436 RepID=A0ABV9F1C3_9SPHN
MKTIAVNIGRAGHFAALMVCDHLIVPVELGPFGPDSTKQLFNSIQIVNQKWR